MRVWRICREPYAADALAGRGGLFTSGRWHTRGQAIVYTSESLALAALEVLAHVDRSTVPVDFVQLEIDVPDDLDIQQIEIKALPKNWRTYPALPDLQRRGDYWLLARSMPILQVPSAVIAEESNFLLNPQHADARKITIGSVQRFTFDSRLTS